MQIKYQYGYDNGSINIEQSGTEITIFKEVGINNENQRGIAFKAINTEQANRWFEVLKENPDLAKNLII